MSVRQLLKILGAPNEQTLKQGIVEEITGELKRRRRFVLPIRLSQVADHFRISPNPLFCALDVEGQIDYDPEKECFRIKLRNDFVQQLPAGPRQIVRARFTYAHEFAHRFFFLERQGRFERANAIVLRNLQGCSRADPYKVHSFEERICNEIASELLIPAELLLTHPAIVSKGFYNDWRLRFGPAIQKLASEFAVSKTCMLVRLQNLIEERRLLVPNNFAFFLIGETRRKRALTGRETVRAEVCYLPSRIGKVRIASAFPGIATDNFGETFGHSVRTILSQAGHRARGRDTWEVTLLSVMPNAQTPIQKVLDAEWLLLGTGPSRRLLVWGCIG